MTDTCSTCVFFVGGQCRQKAPGDQTPQTTTANAKIVGPTYWCGDGISSGDGHYFSTKLNQGPQGPAGPAYSFSPGTATAVAGAATLNALAGVIASEALVAATSYTLTLANNKILSGSVVLVNVLDSSGAVVLLLSVAVTAGQVVVGVSMAALTGTLKFNFAVFN